ncbi:helix-turn-helix domain-containing protein [Streptomyces sp. NPDC088719]|uniref:helix-turn-helix domain-containing protein n=1 Tax=Streptomyces sp. NPDC088719 TaxID=3365872 RepID=UPI0037FBFC41
MASKARIRIRRTPPAELGPMLAAARERTGHTQRRVSIAAGLGRSYVCLIEGGHRTPSRVAAQRLADALQLTEQERAQLYAAAVTDAGLSHPGRSRQTPQAEWV